MEAHEIFLVVVKAAVVGPRPQTSKTMATCIAESSVAEKSNKPCSLLLKCARYASTTCGTRTALRIALASPWLGRWMGSLLLLFLLLFMILLYF